MNIHGHDRQQPDSGSWTGPDLVERARRVSREVLGPTAADVDTRGRFPSEAVQALREEELLTAFLPTRYGGGGCTLSELSRVCDVLARACASTGMIFAMHQAQLASVVRHCRSSPILEAYLHSVARERRLLASATSEVGVGDIRRSACAVEANGKSFRLVKDASVVSYGEYCDDILITARRGPAAANTDQVLVLARRGAYHLERTSDWDTMGMRGTCSLGYRIAVEDTTDHILPDAFSEILSRTTLPITHVLWASVWLGIAENAVAMARLCLQSKATKAGPGALPNGTQLAELTVRLQAMRSEVRSAIETCGALASQGESDDGALDAVVQMNGLKVSSSQAVVAVCMGALQVCGIAGYHNQGSFSLSRPLRDALSAPLMLANERLLSTNGSLLILPSVGTRENNH